MDAIAAYFETIPSWHRTIILVGGLTFFWMLESAKPSNSNPYDKWYHAALNLVFTLTTIAVNFSLAFLLVAVADWAQSGQFGVLNWIPSVSILIKCVLGVLLLDLVGAYLAHWLEHQVKWMWRFHLVHHTDTHVDTTTANRHHPGESVIRFAFTTLAVLVSGAPMWLVMVYQTVSVFLSQFNHANIRLPPIAERVLSWIVVTPSMHHVHHHFKQPYTDANYGNIFAFWDRLFGTFASAERSSLIYGVDTYPDPAETSKVVSLLMIPFRKYRNPEGSKFSKTEDNAK